MTRLLPTLRSARPSGWRAASGGTRRSLALAVVALALGAGERPARAVDDLYTPRTQAMGESLRADASGAIGPMLNPSGMALTRAYTLEAMYGFDVGSLGNNLHLSIVDSTTSKVAAGVYYNFIYATPKFDTRAFGGVPAITAPAVTHTGSETGLALGLPIGDWFTLGATLKYLHFTTSAPNPLYDSVKSPSMPQTLTFDSTTATATASGFTLDFGFTLRLGDKFNLAAVGYNLIPLHSYDAPLALGAGAALKPTPNLTFAFDTVIAFDKYKKIIDEAAGATQNLTTVRLGGGLEWLVSGKVPLRAGSLWDSGSNAGYITAGLGYTSTSFAIDLSMRQQFLHGVDTRLVLGLRVFLGGAGGAPGGGAVSTGGM